MPHTADELWSWFYPALEALRQELHTEPGVDWQQRRQRLLTSLDLFDPTQQPAVEHLLREIDELPADDRRRFLEGQELEQRAYELIQWQVGQQSEAVPMEVEHWGAEAAGTATPMDIEPHADQSTGTAGSSAAESYEESYDAQKWYAFAASHLPEWNGTAETWPTFVEWFDYYAAQQGLGVPATAFTQHLNGLSDEDRIAQFAAYGVVIPQVQQHKQHPAQDQHHEEHPAEHPAVGSASGEITLTEDHHAAMTEALAEDPEFALIPEARRIEILAEVVREQNAAR